MANANYDYTNNYHEDIDQSINTGGYVPETAGYLPNPVGILPDQATIINLQ